MPRKARELSSTGMYHIVIKGLNSQVLFEDSKDYFKFLDILAFYKKECHFIIFSYCLMSNHVHLIIKINDHTLEQIFKRINTRYVLWFNMKYNRTGHLLQDRYYSEPIETLTYLLTAVNYVHRNPFMAGLESNPGVSYQWNSIHEYTTNNSHLVDLAIVSQFLSTDMILKNLSVQSDTKCLDINNKIKISDDIAKKIIFEISSCSNSVEFQSLELIKRNTFIAELHKRGLSIRQINRLTGTSIGSIQRALKNTQ